MKKYFIVSLLVMVVVLLSGVANAASTIGTNMSTTGTFTLTVGSATAARFQNAAGTLTVLQVDTSSGTGRVGVGAAPSTTFEVQGTASASYFFTANTIQVAGTTYASVAYSRFGTATTGYSSDVDASNDVLVTGALEVDGNAFFDGKVGIGGATNGTVKFEVNGTASAAYGFFNGALQAAGTTGASVAYSRFGTGTTNNTGEMDAANDLLITGSLEVDGKASVASNFQMSGRFIADTAASHSFFGNLNVRKTVVVGAAAASGSGAYVAEFVGATTGTASFYFGGGDSATRGSCFQLKSTTGAWIYMRFVQGTTTPTLSTIRCQ